MRCLAPTTRGAKTVSNGSSACLLLHSTMSVVSNYFWPVIVQGRDCFFSASAIRIMAKTILGWDIN